jgi:enamine deaminase RidA (YjgF/YER057c/UK114 family)
MGRIQNALEAHGITLPEPVGAVANYVPVKVVGNLAFVSGQVPMQDRALVAEGPVPSCVSPEQARRAARVCVINALAALKAALDGDIDRIEGIVRLGVFVASDPGFTGQPAIANGASDLLVEVFGDAGRHARAAVGSVALPLNATVEVELIAEVLERPAKSSGRPEGPATTIR